jgi:hypothetical protein
MVAQSTGDVISDLNRLLAAEIGKGPFILTNDKTHVTCKRYTIDSKHILNTDTKPWSPYRLLKSFPVSDVTELVKLCHRCKSS